MYSQLYPNNLWRHTILLLLLVLITSIYHSKAQQILNTRLFLPFGNAEGYQFISNNIRQGPVDASLMVVFSPDKTEGTNLIFKTLSDFTVKEKTSIIFLDEDARTDSGFIQLSDSLKNQVSYYPDNFYLVGFFNDEYTSIPPSYYDKNIPGGIILIENLELKKEQLFEIPASSGDNSVVLISIKPHKEDTSILHTKDSFIKNGSCVENYTVEKVGSHPFESINTDLIKASINWIKNTSCQEIRSFYKITDNEILMEPNLFKRGEYANLHALLQDVKDIYLFDHKGNKIGEYATKKIHTYALSPAAYFIIIKARDGLKSLKFYVEN